MTNVLVITPDAHGLARHWRKIGCGQPDGLNAGFLIDADSAYGVGPRIVVNALSVALCSDVSTNAARLDFFTMISAFRR